MFFSQVYFICLYIKWHSALYFKNMYIHQVILHQQAHWQIETKDQPPIDQLRSQLPGEEHRFFLKTNLHQDGCPKFCVNFFSPHLFASIGRCSRNNWRFDDSVAKVKTWPFWCCFTSWFLLEVPMFHFHLMWVLPCFAGTVRGKIYQT